MPICIFFVQYIYMLVIFIYSVCTNTLYVLSIKGYNWTFSQIPKILSYFNKPSILYLTVIQIQQQETKAYEIKGKTPFAVYFKLWKLKTLYGGRTTRQSWKRIQSIRKSRRLGWAAQNSIQYHTSKSSTKIFSHNLQLSSPST